MNSIKNRYTGAVIIEGDTTTAQLVQLAIEQGANLTRANLMDANLMDANLMDANLMDANLMDANLMDANLMDANLTRANLTRANLMDANLDFASLPLWCGSLKAKTDDRLNAQLLYHVISVMGVDRFTDEQLTFANTFHRVGECPALRRIAP